MKLAYIGQNQDSGLYPKKSGVIFFKAKLLNPKHGDLNDQMRKIKFNDVLQYSIDYFVGRIWL